MSQKSTSWISEEDFYKPEKTYYSEAYAVVDIAQMNGQETPTSEGDGIPSPPSVVHRRHNGKKDTRLCTCRALSCKVVGEVEVCLFSLATMRLLCFNFFTSRRTMTFKKKKKRTSTHASTSLCLVSHTVIKC